MVNVPLSIVIPAHTGLKTEFKVTKKLVPRTSEQIFRAVTLFVVSYCLPYPRAPRVCQPIGRVRLTTLSTIRSASFSNAVCVFYLALPAPSDSFSGVLPIAAPSGRPIRLCIFYAVLPFTLFTPACPTVLRGQLSVKELQRLDAAALGTPLLCSIETHSVINSYLRAPTCQLLF